LWRDVDGLVLFLFVKGRNVVLESKYGSPRIVNDGVTVAREVELEDPVEDIGAKLVRQAAARTNDTAGDGTTTATILSAAIIAEVRAYPLILLLPLRFSIHLAWNDLTRGNIMRLGRLAYTKSMHEVLYFKTYQQRHQRFCSNPLVYCGHPY
jgi:hypothetical protein